MYYRSDLNEVYIVNSVCQSNNIDGTMGKIVIASDISTEQSVKYNSSIVLNTLLGVATCFGL
jgi:hypothetical protein